MRLSKLVEVKRCVVINDAFSNSSCLSDLEWSARLSERNHRRIYRCRVYWKPHVDQGEACSFSIAIIMKNTAESGVKPTDPRLSKKT